ncbi:MAG: AAA family ATPase, partial [Thermoguttaceae bacterium]
MKITALEVDGFGVWSGLKIHRLCDELNVVFGPNEAGKTTLLQFVRSVLYGFSPQRRRYLPPLHGGPSGGMIAVAGPNGSFEIRRLDEDSGERLTITAADGTRQGEHVLKVLLSNIDESIFNNIFAIGLREIQELGTLGDTQAAELLYNIAAGLDRVSLAEVLRELEASRNRILDRGGGPCQVLQLLADREKLRLESEELQASTRRYSRLAAERDQLQREAEHLEEEKNRAEYQAQVVELAIGLGDRWTRRDALRAELESLGPRVPLPEGALERFDALHARLEKRQHRLQVIQRQRQALRGEATGLQVSEALVRHSARIEALQEHQSWIVTVQNQVSELEQEVAALVASGSAERQRLGLGGPPGAASAPNLSRATWAALRPVAQTVGECLQRWRQAQRDTAAAEEAVKGLAQQIETALPPDQKGDLAAAMDRAGNLVAQLRRRGQIDERLDQMTRNQSELAEQSKNLLGHQILPLGALVGLGAVFVLGAV